MAFLDVMGEGQYIGQHLGFIPLFDRFSDLAAFITDD